MLFQTGAADTLNFMLMGMGVILGTITLFVVSIVVRRRNLERDLALLDEVESEQKVQASDQPVRP